MFLYFDNNKKRINLLKIILYSLLISFLSFCYGKAQEAYGNLEGKMVDNNNSPLTYVDIIIQGESLQGIRGASTNNEGYFRIQSLPIGSYIVKISLVGYQSIKYSEIRIHLGETTSLGEVQLQEGKVNMPELVVSGKRMSSDPNSTSYGGNLNSRDFENLPIERNYQRMISLLPQSNLSYFGDGVNVGGATGFENKYFVDGVEVNDPLIGATSTYLPYNFIKEVEVKAGGYEAEFNSALGGVVNVVTNSGTNDFHGSIFGFFTGNNFVSHQELGLLDPTQGKFSDYDFGLSLGGPIVRDELWFFTAYNPTFENRDVNVPDFGNSVDRTIRHSFAGKLNWNAYQNLGVNLIITGDPTKQTAVGRGVLIPPTELINPDPYLQDITEGGINISLNGIYTINPDFLVEAVIARVIRHDTGVPSTEQGKVTSYKDFENNIWSGGVGTEWNSFRAATILKLTGTILIGSHIIIAGSEYKMNETQNNYDYHSIVKYDQSHYEEYLGRGFQSVNQRVPSVFIQDSWKVFDNLTLSTGIRWDGQYIIGSDGKLDQTIILPFQPRIGITYLPDKDGRNKFFGSFGRYSQEFALFQSTGYFSDQTIDATYIYHSDPRVPGTVPDSTISSSGKISPIISGLKGQYYDEFSLGYERLLGENLRIGIQGVYKTLRQAIDDGYSLDLGRFVFGNLGEGLLQSFPRAQRNYKAVILTLGWENDSHFNFIASYVLSKDYGNYAGLFDAITHGEFPNTNSALDNPFFSVVNTTGLLPNDRTHLFKFSGSYNFSFGLTTGLTFTAQSGTPLSDYANTNVGIKFITPRGTAGRTPAIWDLSIRVAYKVPQLFFNDSRLVLDIFHIASQLKPVDINQFQFWSLSDNGTPYDPNPNYGKAYRYQNPMSVRLGLEINY
jgi:hypothetical protein